jgi:hypothetical protein
MGCLEFFGKGAGFLRRAAEAGDEFGARALDDARHDIIRRDPAGPTTTQRNGACLLLTMFTLLLD